MTFKKTLCLDFDGVIHSYTSGWKGPIVIPDPPVPGAIDFIRAALGTFKVAILSSRSHETGGIEAMQLWLRQHAEPGLVAMIDFPKHKPAAFVTLDDRAITFKGEWPTIEELAAFKPWNWQGAA